MIDSETFEATGGIKYIKYGKGSVRGDIVEDTISMGFDSAGDEIKADEFPFLLNYVSRYDGLNQGILGLSPHDDSSGPLLVEHMYKQGVIDTPYFAVLQAPSKNDESYLTLGDYERKGDQMYAPGDSIVAHRVSGSFHWQLKLNSIGY